MKDYTGQRYGAITVLGFSHKDKKKSFWKVLCECGNESVKQSGNLPKAVGCSYLCCVTQSYRNRLLGKHNMKDTRPYRIWNGMISRCHNPRRKDWPRYGGKGIYVCERWRNSFEAFWEDMGPTYAENLSIDRTDNNGPYTKENCAWVTTKDNNRNRSNNVVTRKEREIADAHGISKATLGYRIRAGWPLDKAITVAPAHSNKYAPQT